MKLYPRAASAPHSRRFVTCCLISPALVLLLFLTACDDAPAIEAIEGTVAALSTGSAQQAGEIAAQAAAQAAEN